MNGQLKNFWLPFTQQSDPNNLQVDGATMTTYLDELFPFLIKRISDLKEREVISTRTFYLITNRTEKKLFQILLEVLYNEDL